MRVLVIEPGKHPYVKDIASGLESLQHEVDGYIQALYPFGEEVALICDEEGKLNGKEMNRALLDDEGNIYDIVFGTFLITGLTDEDFGPINDENLTVFREKFRYPELFLPINGKLIRIVVR